MMAPWKRTVRSLLLAFGVACFAVWGVMMYRQLTGNPETPTLMWWRTGILVAGWAALFAFKGLGEPPPEPPDE